MNVLDVVLFILSTIGMSHIIVDAGIMEWFRNFIKWGANKLKIPSFGSVVDCYLCCGTWCGFFMGLIWISHNPFKVLACGFIGGFMSNFAIILNNLLESITLANYSDHGSEKEDKNES